MISLNSKLFFIILTAALLQACQYYPQKQHYSNALAIEVSFRERLMLPPNSELIVTLEDASNVIATTETLINSAPPYALTLDYQRDAKRDNGHFILRAIIRHNNKLLLTGTTHIDVLNHATNNNIKIMTHQPAANTEALLDISGAWQLTALTGQPISLNNTKKTVGLTIDLNNNKMSGFSGCNHFFSSIEINQQKIMIGTIAATMMLCDKEMALEQQYLNALSTTSHYSAQQSQLVLYDNANRPLATFHRQTSKR